MGVRPLACLLVLLCSCAAPASSGRTGVGNAEGSPANLQSGAVVDSTPEGYRATVKSLAARPVVVNFWASWCTPCEEEMPVIVAAAHRYRGRVNFLGVDGQDDPAAAKRFLNRHKMPFPSLGDPRGEIIRAEKLGGLPETKFYRKGGELALVHRGQIDADELEEKIRELIRTS